MKRIHQCGYHTHNPDAERIYRPTGLQEYLFLLVLAPMWFCFSNQAEIRVKSGACILYAPGTPQDYRAEDKFINSYLEFSSDEQPIGPYAVETDCFFYPEDLDEVDWLLKKIYHEYINKMTGSAEMIDAYIDQLLILLHRAQKHIQIPAEQRQHIYPELCAMRERMLMTCEQPWTIAQLCDMLNMGKSQLYRYYRLFFHSSPMDELIQARLQKASYLITNQAMSIKHAAYESGFQEITYFNRQFKARFHCTPGEYRNGKKG